MPAKLVEQSPNYKGPNWLLVNEHGSAIKPFDYIYEARAYCAPLGIHFTVEYWG